MNAEDLRKNPIYREFSGSGKVISVLYLMDPELRGMTLEEIRKYSEHVDSSCITQTLRIYTILSCINKSHRRKNPREITYSLTRDFRNKIKQEFE
jgi:hypothetical protein